MMAKACVGLMAILMFLLGNPAVYAVPPIERSDSNSPAASKDDVQGGVSHPEDAANRLIDPGGEQTSLRILPFENFTCERREVEITVADGDDGSNSRTETRQVLATIGYTPNDTVTIYEWIQDYYFESSETALEICNRVSTLFGTLNQEGVLGLISSGKTAEGNNVICAGETCSRPVFTLLPGEDPQQALDDLKIALTNADITRNYFPPRGCVVGSGSSQAAIPCIRSPLSTTRSGGRR
jgi:hypothetical protein